MRPPVLKVAACLAGLVVSACGVGAIVAAVNKPTPTPSQIVERLPVAGNYRISGPTKALAGQLVRLTADGQGAATVAWEVISDDDFPILVDDAVDPNGKIERGKYLTFSMPAKAKVRFLLMAISGSTPSIAKWAVELDSPVPPTPPTPPVPPPNPPGPTPTPDGVLGLIKVVRDASAAVVDPDKVASAQKIAGNYAGVASAIAAGGIKTHDEAQKAMAEGNKSALGAKVDAWAPCLDAIRGALNKLDDAGKLNTIADVQAAADELATAFKGVK